MIAFAIVAIAISIIVVVMCALKVASDADDRMGRC